MEISGVLEAGAYIAKSKAIAEVSVPFSESSFNMAHSFDRAVFDTKSVSGITEIAMATDVAMNIMQKAMAAYIANMTTAIRI